MITSGDEMELFALVNRKIRQLFSQQEHMKTFRTYDACEVSERLKAGNFILIIKLILFLE